VRGARTLFVGLAAAIVAGGAAQAQAQAQVPSNDQLVARMTAWTRLPKRSIAAVKPDVMVAIVRPGVRNRASEIVEDVVVQSEAADEASAQAAGWRSMRSQVDIACKTRSNRFRRVSLYSGHNLSGTARAHTPPEGWIHPTSKAPMFDVIAAVCGVAPQTIPPGQIVAQTPPPATRPPPIQVGQAAPPPRRSQSLVGADLPEPDSPMPARAATAPATPMPMQSQAPIAAAPARPVAAKHTSGSGVVQIAAFQTGAEAQQALAAFAQTALGQTPGLSPRIETARVKGVVYYRAVLDGFGTIADASAFCGSIKAAGGACFVHP
jgi:hypothetical protein